MPESAVAGFAGFADQPNAVEIHLQDKIVALTSVSDGRWAGDGVEVRVVKTGSSAFDVLLTAPSVAVRKVHLSWAAAFAADTLFLGDAWERAYGDLRWKPINETGPMPWYFLACDRSSTHGYGVMTGPASFCCWRVGSREIDLWADVRNGGSGVELGNRTLTVCTFTDRQSREGEDAFGAARAFCRQMCPHPRVAQSPVYGFNDWYCAYGADTAAGFIEDAAYIASLAPAGKNRPYMVIDDGWQSNRQGGKADGNPWQDVNARFGSSMPEVARAIYAMNAVPGLWYRPLESWGKCPPDWHLTGRDHVLDPSNPAVLQKISETVKRFRGWGYKLIKHDFSTNEITGKWGNAMGDEVPLDGVVFRDRSKTTAEIVLTFYRTLRAAAGEEVLLDGCNTFSHLSAGIFDLARIGDDTSGKEWNRTRLMGVNSIGFRGVQNGAFYLVDPDCAGLAKANAIPWDKNSQWLNLAAHCGTPLFVSWPRQLVGPEQEAALRSALAAAAQPQPLGEPLDWLETGLPARWILDGTDEAFHW